MLSDPIQVCLVKMTIITTTNVRAKTDCLLFTGLSACIMWQQACVLILIG